MVWPSLLLVEERLEPLLEQLRLQAGVRTGVDARHLHDLVRVRASVRARE